MEYNVVWNIQIEAETPEEAARLALEIQRDPSSEATYFNVTDSQTGELSVVDAYDFGDQLSTEERADLDGLNGTAGLEDDLREVF
jgi:hypothetical protein